jgi:hypothetical protein|tara:strand:- start:131 stop:349 length:219 start_codon:yes stop_codon:yes gene_type:complete
MNTIILVTIVAGNIVSSATFGSLNECTHARDAVMLQDNITAYCTYKQVKPDHTKDMFKLFGRMMQQMGELEK